MRLAAVLVALLAFAAPAVAAGQRPTLSDIEDEVICPTCHTTLDMSSSPVADRMRVYIRRWIEQGDSKAEIKRKLVAQFGEGVLAEPPKRGFGLLAWVLPLAGIAVAAAALGVGAWKWSRLRRDGNGAPPSDGARLAPESERLVDDALARFDG